MFNKANEKKSFVKEYIAICEGNFENRSGIINKPISRKENSIIERCVNENGDIAVTHYDLIKNNNDYSILHCTLETGRTHQIRVHLAYIGHPIIGDTLYGNKSDKITRQALHAYKVSFNHPITKQKVEYVAKIPHDIEALM